LDRISIPNQAAKAELKNQERDMAGYAGLIKMRSIGSNIQGPSRYAKRIEPFEGSQVGRRMMGRGET
jgi:hypothetical protein